MKRKISIGCKKKAKANVNMDCISLTKLNFLMSGNHCTVWLGSLCQETLYDVYMISP